MDDGPVPRRAGPGRAPALRVEPPSALGHSLRACSRTFLTVCILSGIVNLLALTGPFFMLEVYDRVLPGRSLPTLAGLALIAGLLYSFFGLLDVLRMRLLTRIGMSLDQSVRAATFDLLWRVPLSRGRPEVPQQPLRDLNQVRGFLSGVGPTAIFDLPWLPLYVGLCFVFHPLIGAAALVSALTLIGVMILTEALVRRPVSDAGAIAAARNRLTEAAVRNAEVMQAMAIAPRLRSLFSASSADLLAAQRRSSDIGNGMSALSKVLRLVVQSAVLGVGAVLVVRQEATAGIMIASSILCARALAPVELALANWRSFLAARQSWRRLDAALRQMTATPASTMLPEPSRTLSVESLTVVPPGAQRPVLHGASFRVSAGSALGVIGPSASGKSSLARALVGSWAPAAGRVALDGAALPQWPCEQLGRVIGYLPQDVELFSGTIGENVSRFDPDADPAAIVAACRAAGAHDMIVSRLGGYDSDIGDFGVTLSAGQRQRIGLARALYGDPFLVVLDEPNSNLDSDGEEALTHAIMAVRSRGGIVVVVAHRPSALRAVDLVLMLADGRIQSFGPKDTILPRYLRRNGSTEVAPTASGPPLQKRSGTS
ncbi:type I secretion system permease/ATPase [Rhodoplanes elegans]|uniref:Type I secretion system permease/ATPase n=1 Tax=Rhodoplanes elegans TaxID=29408 RepID=A0A327KID6_9BRAD|nr:type I secretion system permease/ATPase [Rhodoplanes elegans]MBK5958804.1 type I secretion system permease/ATPase [Rhodoplanes elegans]RAI38559.1 type I secretion system permease/ATPase [Rhodoplanes elegans]